MCLKAFQFHYYILFIAYSRVLTRVFNRFPSVYESFSLYLPRLYGFSFSVNIWAFALLDTFRLEPMSITRTE